MFKYVLLCLLVEFDNCHDDLPDTGAAHLANLQLGQTVQRRFAGIASLQREHYVIVQATLGRRPHHMLDVQFEQQLLQQLRG